MTREEREKRYQAASPKQQFLYAAEEAGERLYQIFGDYHLPQELYREYAFAFGDVVLGFEPEEQLPQLLTKRLGLSEKLSTIIAHDLLEFINSTPTQGGIAVAPETKTPVAPATSVPPPPAVLEPQEKAVPPSPPEPEPVAEDTVPEDAPTIPSYRRPMTDTPRYIKDDPYREPPR
jgi:hypothetical protein